MKTPKSLKPNQNSYITTINSYKNDVANKIKKYLDDNHLTILHYEWRKPSPYDIKKCKVNFKRYLKCSTIKSTFTNAKILANCSCIDFYYDIVTKEDIEKFEKEEWPKFIANYEKHNSISNLSDKLENLRKAKENIERQMKELTEKLATKSLS